MIHTICRGLKKNEGIRPQLKGLGILQFQCWISLSIGAHYHDMSTMGCRYRVPGASLLVAQQQMKE